MIEPSSFITRDESVLAAEIDGEIVLMSVTEGRYFGLNKVGSDIWKRLATPQCFGELCSALLSEYDAAPETISAEVEALLIRMSERQLVSLLPR